MTFIWTVIGFIWLAEFIIDICTSKINIGIENWYGASLTQDRPVKVHFIDGKPYSARVNGEYTHNMYSYGKDIISVGDKYYKIYPGFLKEM